MLGYVPDHCSILRQNSQFRSPNLLDYCFLLFFLKFGLKFQSFFLLFKERHQGKASALNDGTLLPSLTSLSLLIAQTG